MTEFTCEVDEDYRSACEGLDFYAKHEGKQFCVLHYPGEDKKENFNETLVSKLKSKDYNFRGTVFPAGTARFDDYEFDAPVYFDGAVFNGSASFTDARFSGDHTDFSQAQFPGEYVSFFRAKFNSMTTLFKGTKFGGGVDVTNGLQFNETEFTGFGTSFEDAVFSCRFTDFTEAKFSSSVNTIFSGAYFTGQLTNFYQSRFSSRNTHFEVTKFDGQYTHFSQAQFVDGETFFNKTRFNGEYTRFLRADFRGEGIYFLNATFMSTLVDFSDAAFRQRFYLNAVFGSKSWVQFENCLIEKPERFKFISSLLNPGWFINVDVRKVDFTNVRWHGLPNGPKGALDAELGSLKSHFRRFNRIGSPYVLLSQACQRLSANAEENGEYPLANEFHYWSMDALRKERWFYLTWLRQKWPRVRRRYGLASTLRWAWRVIRRKRLKGTTRDFGPIATLYWTLSGYGERAGRAFWALVAIWAAFTTLYMLVASSQFETLSDSIFSQALGYVWQAGVYSLLALARLNPEPKPEEPGLFQFLVGFEGILGPLQIALLLLAIWV